MAAQNIINVRGGTVVIGQQRPVRQPRASRVAKKKKTLKKAKKAALKTLNGVNEEIARLTAAETAENGTVEGRGTWILEEEVME